MTDDDLDEFLRREDDIVPSSGFAAGVMDAVRREASAPSPLPFPWKRVVPGIALSGLALLGLLILAIRQFYWGGGVPADAVGPVLINLVKATNDIGAGWVALALLLSFASVKVSMRLAGGRT